MPPTCRRQFLKIAGAFGTGAALGLTACSGGKAVRLLAAGSLNNALENGLRKELPEGIRLEVEARGSAAVARMVAEGQRDPDVVTLADAALFDGPLDPPWYAEFATNALVLAYHPDTEGGRALHDAGPDRWYEPIRRGTVRVGRTDPDEDPLGYRTLMMLELASRYYDLDDNLRETIPTREQVYPETGLISQFETGSIDAAFAYRNMAAERNYAYLRLPDPIDFSTPAHEDDWYRTTTYALPGGTTVTGGVIRYASTIRTPQDAPGREAAIAVFAAQCTGSYLRTFGLTVPDDYPLFHGELPADVPATRDALRERRAS
jgi:molybdate/tungstate transport system substrate-binding protein